MPAGIGLRAEPGATIMNLANSPPLTAAAVFPAPLADRFARDLVGNLPQSLFDLLSRLVDGGDLAARTVDQTRLTELQSRLPSLVQVDAEADRIRLADPSAAAFLGRAIAWRESVDLTRAAAVLSDIAAAIAADDQPGALTVFRREGGAFFAHRHGLFAAQEALSLFPVELQVEHETLVLSRAINAMKSGSYTHADHLMARRFGSGCHRLGQLQSSRVHRSDEFRIVCFIRAVYADQLIDDSALGLLFDVLGRLAPDADLQRGLLLNVALDVFVRRRAWDMAEETAAQALFHFRRQHAPLSAFYIGLYRGVIDLARGELSAAAQALAEAGQDLRRLPTVSPNDQRLLDALTLVCDYEAGRHDGLVALAQAGADASLFGEIWPSVAEPIIFYGSMALSTHVGLAAARAYLARWRVQELYSERTFRFLALQEVRLLQMHRRWREAGELLAALESGSLDGVRNPQAPGEEIELALAALRDRMARAPSDPDLPSTLESLHGRPELTLRQRSEVALLQVQAQLAARNHDSGTLRCGVLELAEATGDRGLAALRFEQRDALQRLMGDKIIRAALGPDREGLRPLLPAGDAAVDQGRTAETDLTARELEILLLLAENTPNKVIAARLDVSVPTVRFHLKNLYRKLGCPNRSAAVRDAAKRGLVSA